jgi:hypothetical protein
MKPSHVSTVFPVSLSWRRPERSQEPTSRQSQARKKAGGKETADLHQNAKIADTRCTRTGDLRPAMPPTRQNPLSALEVRLRDLSATSDFAGACQSVAVASREAGARLAAECEREGVPYDAGFWPACAIQAERAAAIYAEAMAVARRYAAATLRSEGLELYAEALESGDYIPIGF